MTRPDKATIAAIVDGLILAVILWGLFLVRG